MAEELMLKVEDVYKRYRLGLIGGGTLAGDLQSWWAKVRHKEDPNSKIGAKTYGKNESFYALNGISFEVHKGEALGIIGGNGAGKSTTLKLLSQVTAPTSGKIYLNGRVASMLEVGTGFHPELTGRENIYLNGAILGMTKAEIDAKIEEIIDFSECRQFIDTPVKRYSSGMYVKLAFSVAAHLDSEIMIMDEVLAVGDMAFQKKCIDKMKSISNDEGRTILYVSHNMSTIRRLCTRCICMDKGHVIYNGDVDQAISIYLSENIQNLQQKFFEKKDHETWYIPKMFVTKAKIKNEISEIYCGDVVGINISYHAVKNADNLKVRLVLHNEYGEIIGMSISQNEFQIKEETEGEIEVSFDTRNLAPGRYYFAFSVFEISEIGGHDYVCVVRKFMSVTINDKPELHSGMNWSASSWGNIAFEPFQVEKIK